MFRNPDEEDLVAPTVNAISICLRCCGIALFDENLDLRRPSFEERIAIMDVSEVRKALVSVNMAAYQQIVQIQVDEAVAEADEVVDRIIKNKREST